jgi:hypothetical protein
MNEFLLIFRRDFKTPEAQPSPEKLQGMMKDWQDWMGSIAAQNKLADSGNRLDPSGSVVRSDDSVTNGPYVEVKEGIGGYIVIRAGSLEEASEISKGCPVLTIGGNVEVRQIVPMPL